MGDFTVTLIGKGGCFTTEIKDELDFSTHPHEVCLMEMVFAPGSWCNVRSKSNWFLVYNQKDKKSNILEIPPRQYETVSDILYELNVALSNAFTHECDMFYYHDNTKTVFPHPENQNLTLWNKINKLPRVTTIPLTLESFKTRDATPTTVKFGSGISTDLIVTFCCELAIILGVVESMSLPVPGILPGWSVKVKQIELTKNNLAMLWVFGDFITTTMAGSARIPVLKMVPIVDDTKAITHSVFNMQDFVMVQRRRIKQFEIKIQEGPTSSDALSLTQEVILVLYFKPIIE